MKVGHAKETPLFFHYTSFEAALKIIISGKIRFSSPLLSNDPFEFLFVHPNEKNADGFIEECLRITGVFCCSKISNNLLMWSHYAQKHTGVVLGFRANTEPYKIYKMNDEHFLLCKAEADEDILGVGMVYYSSELYSPSEEDVFSEITDGRRLKDQFISRFLLQKSTDWEYEQEIRFHKTLPTSKQTDPLGYELVSLKNCGLELECLFFGLKCPTANKEMIISALKCNDEYRNTKLYQMDRTQGHYKLEANKLKAPR